MTADAEGKNMTGGRGRAGVHSRMPTVAKKKSLGQYFTTSPRLQDFIYSHVQYKGQPLLEPSVGAGHLLQPFLTTNAAYPITAYEVDPDITRLPLQPMQSPIIADFLTAEIDERFATIIGNPPFVKRKGRPNLYIDFVAKCVDLLTPTGELLFIVPSDFLKLTSAAALLEKMVAEGAFTDFLFPNNEGLFAGAAIDVVGFRYQRGLVQSATQAKVDGTPMHVCCNKGIITFATAPTSEATTIIADRFHVYVGIVSGRDSIYKRDIGETDILVDKDTVERFILPRSWPPANPEIAAHMTANKAVLMERKIRKFNDANWWQWGALRNIAAIEAAAGQSCIYVRNMTRADEVAFVGTVQMFGGSLLCLIPKEPITEEALAAAAATINQKREEYLYSGRFKIGQKQVCYLAI